MGAVHVVPAAAVGEELLDGLQGRHRADRDGLRLDLRIHHHGRVGHDRLAFGINLRHIHHHGDAVGHDRFAVGIELGRLDDQLDVGGHVVAFVIGLLHLGRVRLHQAGRLVRLPGLRHALPGQRNGPEHRKGNDEVEQAAGQIHPEIAHALDASPASRPAPPPPAPPAPRRRSETGAP